MNKKWILEAAFLVAILVGLLLLWLQAAAEQVTRSMHGWSGDAGVPSDAGSDVEAGPERFADRAAPEPVVDAAAPAPDSDAQAKERSIERPLYDLFWRSLEDEVHQLEARPVDNETVDVTDASRFYEQIAVRAKQRSELARAALATSGRLPDAAARRFNTLWGELDSELRYLVDVGEWASGTLSIPGTMRSDMRRAWMTAGVVEKLVLLESFSKNDAEAYARDVRICAHESTGVRDFLAELSTRAEEWLDLAPESFVPNRPCVVPCWLGRQDYLKRLIVVRSLPRQTGEMASLVCRSWPGLATSLGGALSCEKLLNDSLIGLGPGGSIASEREQKDPFDGAPLPRDSAFARFADPRQVKCLAGFHDDGPDWGEAARCVERARQDQEERLLEARDVSEVLAQLAELTRLACELDELVRDMHHGGISYCRPLADLRVAFLAHSWRGEEASAFVDHVRFRGRASKRVESTREALQALAEQPRCDENQRDNCRESSFPEERWQAVPSMLAELDEQTTSVAKVLCIQWRALRTGMRGECAEALRVYFTSYIHNATADLKR